MITIIKKIFIVSVLGFFLFNVKISLAQITYTAQIEDISGKSITINTTTKALGEYIKNIYNYGVGIAAIVATVVLMIGGFQWIIAGGSGEKIGEAKAWISAALSGLVLVLSSYTLLNLINPNLVNFKIIDIASILKIEPIEPDLEFSMITSGRVMSFNFNKYDAELKKAAKDAGMDCNLLKAIMYTESQGNPNATGPVRNGQRARGLIQIMPDALDDINGGGNQYDPQNNLNNGAKYYKYLEKYGCDGKSTTKGPFGFGIVCNTNNVRHVLAAYNGGMRGANKLGYCGKAHWECPGTLPETKNYVNIVLSNLTVINTNGWGCR